MDAGAVAAQGSLFPDSLPGASAFSSSVTTPEKIYNPDQNLSPGVSGRQSMGPAPRFVVPSESH